MRKEKMNNKGFSLVELIIVIAIMAILIVVLAPQYLKYVERSRNSTDVSNATEIVTALQVYAADPDAKVAIPKTEASISIGTTDAIITDEFAATALVEAGLATGTLTDGKCSSATVSTRCQSKDKWTGYTIKYVSNDNGGIKFTYSQTEGTAGAFDAAMKGKSVTAADPAGK